MKTHRIISIILGAALTASLAGCSKEAVGSAEQQLAEQQLVEFSLSAALSVPGGDTKVALGGAEGLSPLWKNNDQIRVLDADMKPVGPDGLFTISAGSETQTGTFSGKVYMLQTPTYAIYPTSVYDPATKKFTLHADQDGTIKSAVMLGRIVQGENGFTTTFTNVCSVLKINTGDYGKTDGASAIKSVTVSTTDSAIAGEFTIDWDNLSISPATNGTASNSVTAVATSESGFATGTDIYIPVIPTGNQTFEFEFINTEPKYASVSESFEAAANYINALGTAGGMEFKPYTLPGEFTVGENKTVQFSRGNLYWDGSKFLFEKKQWESTPSSDGDVDPSHVSHFYWSKDACVAYSEDYYAANKKYGIEPSEDDVFFTNDPTDAEKANPDFTVNGETGKYRTLSITEWQYLFNTRDDASSKYGFATVADVHGIIILPDGEFKDPRKNKGSGAFVPSATTGWTANVYTTGGGWEAMEAAGAVFLPAAGYCFFSCNVNNVSYVGDYGYSWSSFTHYDNRAYLVYFDSDDVDNFDDSREYGRSVRLITDCKRVE